MRTGERVVKLRVAGKAHTKLRPGLRPPLTITGSGAGAQRSTLQRTVRLRGQPSVGPRRDDAGPT